MTAGVREVEFKLHGLPAPQGSKRHVGNGIMVESSKRVKPWREDVRQAALAALHIHDDPQLTGPLYVQVEFTLPRPKTHYGTGRNAHQLRGNSPVWVAGRPDLDKLLRAVLDALTSANVWRDDAQVAELLTVKRYGDRPGATVYVRELSGPGPRDWQPWTPGGET